MEQTAFSRSEAVGTRGDSTYSCVSREVLAMLTSKPRIEEAEQRLSELSLGSVMSCPLVSTGSLPRSSSQGRFGAPRYGGLGLIPLSSSTFH